MENNKYTDPSKLQTLCRYCWNPELRHLNAEEQTKLRAEDAGTDKKYITFKTIANDSLYEQGIVWDRRDLEGETAVSFAKVKPEDLMFVFPKEQTDEERQIICYQRYITDNRKRMKLEMFHAQRALKTLHDMRPKQTVANFARMLAESMLPQSSSELLIQAVAKEIYHSAIPQAQDDNQSA